MNSSKAPQERVVVAQSGQAELRQQMSMREVDSCVP